MTAMSWLAQMMAIQAAAIASCKAEAHVVDGIAANPRFCDFDPHTLICDREETENCLTQKQAAAMTKIYQGPKDPKTGIN